jgi:peptide/nickel transport system substrate-binding protein
VGRGRRLRLLLLALLVAGGVFVQAGSTSSGQSGGVFRISFTPASGLDHIDPALSYSPRGWALLDTMCARLMTHPDKPLPEAYDIVPEVAAGYPRISDDFKTYTFRLRTTFRFSDGSPVRASAFAHAINRTLAPEVKSPGAMFTQDIVGAADVLAGRRKTAAGVVARGNTLIVRFTRPAPDFVTRTTLPFFCAVPPGLPSHPEGVGAFHSAGPYYAVEYRPGERVEIRRNRFYGGTRTRHVDGFDVDLRAPTPADMIRRIDRGEADWGHTVAGVYMDPTLGLVEKHGVNRTRFFVRPGLTVRMLAFNASRPLFRNNPGLRRAINFALDRQALQVTAGGPIVSTPTDQYLPHSIPGYRNAAIYPLRSPDLARARALARGKLRRAKAIFYAPSAALPMQTAQLVKQQLAEIGLQVEVRPVPLHIETFTYFNKLAARGEKWDMALLLWQPGIPDPYAFINLLLETPTVDGATVTRFRSRTYRREMERAARELQSRERGKAYGALDVRLARDAAPLAPVSVLGEVTLVSDRVGCVTLRPMLDLTTVCLDD